MLLSDVQMEMNKFRLNLHNIIRRSTKDPKQTAWQLRKKRPVVMGYAVLVFTANKHIVVDAFSDTDKTLKFYAGTFELTEDILALP